MSPTGPVQPQPENPNPFRHGPAQPDNPDPFRYGPPLPPPVESVAEARQRSGLPAAVWVGLVGSALTLLATLSIVVNSWDSIGSVVRVIGLAVGTVATIAIAERLRTVTPTMANLIAHLGGGMTTSVGIAATSMFGYPWPACIVIGGIAGLAVTWRLAPRWAPSRFEVGQVANVVLIAVGVAALTHTTAGLWTVAAAVVFSLADRPRRAAALAGCAVLSPAAIVVTRFGVGTGTLARAGVVGSRLAWSGPIVGVIAGAVLVIAARRLSNSALVAAGAAAPAVGVFTGLLAAQTAATAWYCIPGLVLIAAEVVGRERRDYQLADAIASVLTAVAGPVAFAVWLLAPSEDVAGWILPATITLAALSLSVYRWRRAAFAMTDPALATCAVLAGTASTVLGVPDTLGAILATLSVAVVAFLSPRRGVVAVSGAALFAIANILRMEVATPIGRGIAITLLAIVIGIVLTTRTRRAMDWGLPGHVELFCWQIIAALTMARTLATAHTLGIDIGAVALITVTVVSTISVLIDVRSRWTQLVSIGIGGTYLVVPTLIGSAHGYTDDIAGTALACTIAAIGFAVTWWRGAFGFAGGASAIALVAAVASGGVELGIAIDDRLALGFAVAVALGGLAIVLNAPNPLDAGALAAIACTGLQIAPSSDHLWSSGIIILFGLQTASLGWRRPNRAIEVVGLATAGIGVVSAALGPNIVRWITQALTRWDVRQNDIRLCSATLAALVIGYAVWRRAQVSSWIAFGPGLLIGGTWLIAVAAARTTVWGPPLGLVLGAGAVAFGATKRLAAPLAMGTTVLIAILLSWTNLGGVPMWIWFGGAGLFLLGVAVAIERGSKQGTTLHDLLTRWQ